MSQKVKQKFGALAASSLLVTGAFVVAPAQAGASCLTYRTSSYTEDARWSTEDWHVSKVVVTNNCGRRMNVTVDWARASDASASVGSGQKLTSTRKVGENWRWKPYVRRVTGS